MTDLERYTLNDDGESIEALVSDLERCQQDLATARENYTTARDNYRDRQREIAAFYVTLATALNLPVETPAADIRARLWQALRERAALMSDLERVTAERDDALDEAKTADLHRNLNRRVAGALGLLDERVDADTGETYLPSWHDMPEQVTALRAEVERLTAANEELRLTLAAEQGRAEGAPSERWHVSYDLHDFCWWRGEDDEPPEVECHLSGGDWRWTKPGLESNPYPTALDCMNAADKDSP